MTNERSTAGRRDCRSRDGTGCRCCGGRGAADLRGGRERERGVWWGRQNNRSKRLKRLTRLPRRNTFPACTLRFVQSALTARPLSLHCRRPERDCHRGVGRRCERFALIAAGAVREDRTQLTVQIVAAETASWRLWDRGLGGLPGGRQTPTCRHQGRHCRSTMRRRRRRCNPTTGKLKKVSQPKISVTVVIRRASASQH